MIEVFVTIVVISVLVFLLLPSVQSAREMARRTSCANNLMQVGVATNAYHSAFQQYPTQLHGSDANDRRLSFLVPILPFLGQDRIYQRINSAIPRRLKPTGGTKAGTETEAGDTSGDSQVDEFADGMEAIEELDDYEFGMDMMGSYDETLQREKLIEDVRSGLVKPESVEFWPVGGAVPSARDYGIWDIEIPTYRCPSDPGVGLPSRGRTNYAACLGDGIVTMETGPFKKAKGVWISDEENAKQCNAAMRGVFVPRSLTRRKDVRDGASSTILLGEIATDLSDRYIATDPVIVPPDIEIRDNPNWVRNSALVDPEMPMFWLASVNKFSNNTNAWGRGYQWADGAPLFTGFNTILPPNSEISIVGKRPYGSGVLSTSSRHQTGAHVVLVDGATRFVTDTVDCGDANAPSVYHGSGNGAGSKSPYGVWGAMGTRANAELIQPNGI